MKLELRKISRLAVCNLCLCLGLAGYAQASSLSTSTSSTVTAFDYSADKPEENEKLINNVKVFYNGIADQVAVQFKLSKSSTVSIRVMDALGNEVLSLHNGSLEAGVQNLQFETHQKLTDGFYFVRVSSGSETIVKRISVRN